MKGEGKMKNKTSGGYLEYWNFSFIENKFQATMFGILIGISIVLIILALT